MTKKLLGTLARYGWTPGVKKSGQFGQTNPLRTAAGLGPDPLTLWQYFVVTDEETWGADSKAEADKLWKSLQVTESTTKTFREFITESHQRPCDIFEATPGKWYYAVADKGTDDFADEYEADAYDWRRYASVGGPFKSEDEAADAMLKNHSNPGGWNSYDQAWLQAHGGGDTWKKLAKRAQTTRQPYRFNPYTGR